MVVVAFILTTSFVLMLYNLIAFGARLTQPKMSDLRVCSVFALPSLQQRPEGAEVDFQTVFIEAAGFASSVSGKVPNEPSQNLP